MLTPDDHPNVRTRLDTTELDKRVTEMYVRSPNLIQTELRQVFRGFPGATVWALVNQRWLASAGQTLAGSADGSPSPVQSTGSVNVSRTGDSDANPRPHLRKTIDALLLAQRNSLHKCFTVNRLVIEIKPQTRNRRHRRFGRTGSNRGSTSSSWCNSCTGSRLSGWAGRR